VYIDDETIPCLWYVHFYYYEFVPFLGEHLFVNSVVYILQTHTLFSRLWLVQYSSCSSGLLIMKSKHRGSCFYFPRRICFAWCFQLWNHINPFLFRAKYMRYKIKIDWVQKEEYCFLTHELFEQRYGSKFNLANYIHQNCFHMYL
jgi:hypothetical protein